ncbi:uncharacterized protein LOC134261523 [Saccostrea cucullata]|uniref:uncharacterized protein LOC134261523 n=1 Tax=Saccostrea cuccullata TaxID=36930 RepID=UPI002ED51029
MQLTTSPASTCEMIGDSADIAIIEEDKKAAKDDPDFEEDLPENGKKKTIILTDFTDADVYKCCEMPPCRRKKLKNGTCPICSREESENNVTKRNCVSRFPFYKFIKTPKT